VVCTEGVDASACGVDTAAGLSEIGATAGVCVAGTFIGTSGMGVADTTPGFAVSNQNKKVKDFWL